MSARAMSRASAREMERRSRRLSRRARTGVGVAAAVGATALGAGAANAVTFEVTNDDATGPGSLRAAITAANATPAADVVTFAPTLSGTIVLNGSEITITEPLDIQGPGADVLSVDGDNASQIFDIDGDAMAGVRMPVTISGLTLTGGNTGSSGGAIYGEFTNFTLRDSLVTGNEAGTGGGVYLDSAVVAVIGSEISSNRSANGGGGLYVDADNDPVGGLTTDTVTITDSIVRNNRALAGSGGGVYIDDETGGEALFERTTIAGNRSSGNGGGIQFYGHHGPSTIRQSTISGNSAGGPGGGFSFDTAYPGSPGRLLVENSTVSSNKSDTNGGGAYIDNSENKPVSFINSTIAGNAADLGGGIARVQFDVSISSTVLAGNTALLPTQRDLADVGASPGSFIVGDSLIQSPTNATFTQAAANLVGVDPLLGPLADNGGPTRTQLPAEGSPVINKGVANGLTVDQRGLPRTANGGTDIGSVELADAKVEGAKVQTAGNQKFKKKVKVKVVASAAEAATVKVEGTVKAKKSYPLKAVSVDLQPNADATLILKPTKGNASKKIAKFLKSKGKKASAKVALTLTFKDAAGNVETKTAKTKLKLKPSKKK